MRPNRHDTSSQALNAMTMMVMPNEALAASQRLYRGTKNGLRFCCENREVLSLQEAEKRDEQEARRKQAYASRHMPRRNEPALEDEPTILELIDTSAELLDEDEDDLLADSADTRLHDDWDIDPDALILEDETYDDEVEMMD